MINKLTLQASDVNFILQAAIKEAQDNQWAVSIAVVDEGGHLLAMTRLDGVPTISVYMCQEKARSSALGRRESRIYEEIINNGRTSFLSAPQLQGLIEGGVPIVIEGQVIGAVGVSGVKSQDDARIAKAGIAALLAIYPPQ
jgi:glc operon protein GlcG